MHRPFVVREYFKWAFKLALAERQANHSDGSVDSLLERASAWEHRDRQAGTSDTDPNKRTFYENSAFVFTPRWASKNQNEGEYLLKPYDGRGRFALVAGKEYRKSKKDGIFDNEGEEMGLLYSGGRGGKR
ncbi:hypothetical protein niasHT_011420 [Heterodera trifolii]|uniref:Uncharacterized protein n=1 Tax=Heterodera trifolii TaxID=157864 RepID=A0ABD2LL02_9BILA